MNPPAMFPQQSIFKQYNFGNDKPPEAEETRGNSNEESHPSTATTTPENQQQGGSRRGSILETLLSPKGKNLELSDELNTDFSAALWGSSLHNQNQSSSSAGTSSMSSGSNGSENLSKSTSPLPNMPFQQRPVNFGMNYHYTQQGATNDVFPNMLHAGVRHGSDSLASPLWTNPQVQPSSSSSPPRQPLSGYGHNRFNSIDNSMLEDQQRFLAYQQQFMHPQQQQQQQHPASSFMGATQAPWMGNGSAPNQMFQSQIPQRSQTQPQLGQTQPVVQQQPQSPIQQQQHSSPPQQQQQRRSSLDSTGGFINEYQGIDPHSNLAEVLKSDGGMQKAYKSIDGYFTFDQYQRVPIQSYTEDHLCELFENLIKSGAQLPRFSGAQFTSTQLMLIAFKAGRIDVFYKPETSKLEIEEGDLVIVEADRGCDLGKIIRLNVSLDEARLLKYLQHQEQQAALASFDQVGSQGSINAAQLPNAAGMLPGANANLPTLHFPKPILRLASANEAVQLTNKNSDEEKAKKICSLKVQSLNLSMCVIDAEYQSDRRKLTFYYNASHRIDFRDLVRDLFRIYKTRIWMCAVNSDISPEVASGFVADKLPNTNTNLNSLISNEGAQTAKIGSGPGSGASSNKDWSSPPHGYATFAGAAASAVPTSNTQW
ncbi:hypothetical protein WICPIJ_001921 [Wickerhamomyces pijperi]|uniref:PSP1 C-terminal domain-containing protein n=1 Tax=Wickerhamomyces pijperi TaxID=599730 RepID=A0A9P8Q9X4_WICPI|nr:hypothetical protein WICPIJ_001921 [Wickerhamomyces pijperi]